MNQRSPRVKIKLFDVFGPVELRIYPTRRQIHELPVQVASLLLLVVVRNQILDVFIGQGFVLTGSHAVDRVAGILTLAHVIEPPHPLGRRRDQHLRHPGLRVTNATDQDVVRFFLRLASLVEEKRAQVQPLDLVGPIAGSEQNRMINPR